MSKTVTRSQKVNSENSQNKDTLQCAKNTPSTSSSKLENEKNSKTLKQILKGSPEEPSLKQDSSQESTEDSDSGFITVKSK